MKKIIVVLFLMFFVKALAVQIQLNLKEKEKFNITIKSEVLVQFGELDSVFKTKTSTNAVWELEVLDIKKDTVDISLQLKRMKLIVSTPSGKKEFDTDKIKDISNPLLAVVLEYRKTPLIYVVSRKDFQVIKVKNLDVIFENVLTKLKIKDEKLKEKVLKKLKSQSKLYDTGYVFGSNMIGYLNREIEIGKSFNVKQELVQSGLKFNIDLTYTPKKIDENFVYFKLSSSFAIPFQEMSFNGMKIMVNLKGNQEGDLTVYRDCGLPKFFSVKQKLQGNMAQKGAGNGHPTSIDSITIIRYKKVK